MASKKGKEIEKENKLQAVIVADIFNENFQPISADLPPVLLPLINSRCLNYTINWLRRKLVDEVLIYCKAKYSTQFKEICSPWQMRTVGIKVILIPLENMNSIGDAMRDLYAKSLIKSDFILLSGNVIGNLDFKELIEVHKNQRQKHNSIVMSTVYTQYEEDWGEEHYNLATLFTHLPTSQLLVHHRPPGDLIICKKAVDTAKKGGGELYTRMCDPNVLICSEILPSLFSDNFDYDTKESLINGIIGEEDLMGYTINFIHAEGVFCLNLDNFGAYQKMSIALMAKRCVPLICEKSQETDRWRYKFMPFPIIYYDESATFLDFDSVGELVTIDAASVIDDDAKVENCSIGKHCEIGSKTEMEFCFIQNNVKIGNNCKLDRCYIADNVTILSGVTVEPGVVIGSNVTIGPNVIVPMRTRLVASECDNGFTKSDQEIIGAQGKGFIYLPNFPKEIFNCRWGIDLSMQKELDEAPPEDESDEEDNPMEEMFSDDDDDGVSDFTREVKDSIINGIKENSDPENIVLEINASRHAYNVKLEDVQKIVIKHVLQAFEIGGETSLSGEQLWQSVKKSINTLSAVISKYVQKPKDQITALVAIEELVCDEERYLPVMQKILYELNQELELLDDEVIIEWFENYEPHTKAFSKISNLIRKFVEWLEDDDDDE